MPRVSYPFTRHLRKKGWTMRDLRNRWGIANPKTTSRIARSPSQMHLDALEGLPDRRESDDSKETSR